MDDLFEFCVKVALAVGIVAFLLFFVLPSACNLLYL